MPALRDVLVPSSEAEAIELFRASAGTTVVGGGTIVVPSISQGRLAPARAMFLHRAGLAGISRAGSTVTIGAMTPVSELLELSAPLGPCAANVADNEIRAQGTVGGNLCAVGDGEVPRGDLQGAFLALDARVRSAGADGERNEPVEEFLARDDGRLVLDVSYDEPVAGAFEQIRYPHTHTYTVLALCAARSADGQVRLAATGLAGTPIRLRAAEAAGDPEAAGAAAAAEATFADDALASAWYRAKTLPVLVRRALATLQEQA
jgi:CO/xanthine dehydrogenase FAD-binding subunit